MWSDTSEDAVISDAWTNLKQKLNKTSICAPSHHQKKCPKKDESIYYTTFKEQRRNGQRIVRDGRYAGLMNNTIICYANSIFQIIASCNHLNKYLLTPPSEEHKHFRLYYEFARVISSMISAANEEIVDSRNFMNVFITNCPQFINNKRTYCCVVPMNEVFYIYIFMLLIYFLFFQTSEDAHEYIMALRNFQLDEL